ncbi:MAG: hypothetical protein RLZZ387_2703 [Chloroflexota bacterium]|jgi:hypothetical protein
MTMDSPRLGFRQVHLDFHTAPEIPDVGADWDAESFAETVKEARIDSMTVFSKCHHGFSYHPTAIGTMHPSLTFDLLGAQVEALHRVAVRAPIYISVGWDELMADQHPEWRQVDSQGRLQGRGPRETMGWRLMDLATPYADYVLAQTEEVLRRYGPVDGIFFDIVRQDLDGNFGAIRAERMRRDGVDLTNTAQVRAWALAEERRFLERAHRLVAQHAPGGTVFFNSRLRVDRDAELSSRAELPHYSHIEIESLPSVQWGYNHYPLFASYFQTLGLPLLGMTGIFHKSWADFGGLKPQAALLYECARMAASGAVCSVGDQLHPRGALDQAAYRRLGEVFSHIETIEPYVADAEAVPEVGVLLAETGPRFHVVGREVDEGAMRMLLELHRPFQFLDSAADLSPYKVIIAPDTLTFTPDLAAKVQAYVDAGGALLLTHHGGLQPDRDRFALDTGVTYEGDAPHSPDFLVAGEALGAPLTDYHQVLYDRGSRVRAHAGTEVLAWVGEPYFTRSPEHFLSHQHTPYAKTADYPAVTQHGRVIYCHSPLFGAYRAHAVPQYRRLIGALLDRLVPERVVETPGLPTTAEVTLLRQPQAGGRLVLHLIHATPQRRGEGVEVVEDILPLYSVRVGVRAGRPVARALLGTTGEALPHETVGDVTWVTGPEVRGHQVVVFE